jgi:hypothetical protein
MSPSTARGIAEGAEGPRGPAARLARALEWQRQLDAGEVASRAEIARREGLLRARVTQITNGLRPSEPEGATEKRPKWRAALYRKAR